MLLFETVECLLKVPLIKLAPPLIAITILAMIAAMVDKKNTPNNHWNHDRFQLLNQKHIN